MQPFAVFFHAALVVLLPASAWARLVAPDSSDGPPHGKTECMIGAGRRAARSENQPTDSVRIGAPGCGPARSGLPERLLKHGGPRPTIARGVEKTCASFQMAGVDAPSRPQGCRIQSGQRLHSLAARLRCRSGHQARHRLAAVPPQGKCRAPSSRGKPGLVSGFSAGDVLEIEGLMSPNACCTGGGSGVGNDGAEGCAPPRAGCGLSGNS